jgi:hypothetical protein
LRQLRPRHHSRFHRLHRHRIGNGAADVFFGEGIDRLISSQEYLSRVRYSMSTPSGTSLPEKPHDLAGAKRYRDEITSNRALRKVCNLG